MGDQALREMNEELFFTKGKGKSMTFAAYPLGIDSTLLISY